MKEKITVLLGSKSDLAVLKPGFDILKKIKVPYKMEIISAHRNPEKLRKYCLEMEKKGTTP